MFSEDPSSASEMSQDLEKLSTTSAGDDNSTEIPGNQAVLKQWLEPVEQNDQHSLLLQVFDLNTDSRVQLLCGHLSHSKAVHLQHYRQMSGFIEKVKIPKIMMVQEMNLVGEMRGKPLEDSHVNGMLSLLHNLHY